MATTVQKSADRRTMLVPSSSTVLRDTTFSPFDPTITVWDNSSWAATSGGCDAHRCPMGFACSYQELSLSCTPCSAGTQSQDGLVSEDAVILPPFISEHNEKASAHSVFLHFLQRPASRASQAKCRTRTIPVIMELRDLFVAGAATGAGAAAAIAVE